MIFKHGQRRSQAYWQSVLDLYESDPTKFVEFLLAIAAVATAAIALSSFQTWPFGFIALLFGLAASLLLLVRETMRPTFRGSVNRLIAVVVFGLCLAFLLFFVEEHVKLYG